MAIREVAYSDLVTYVAPAPKEHGWSSDDALDWARAQTVTPPKAVAFFLTARTGFLAGTVSRTKAQRAFQRAFPEECTEAFDGICRCKYGISPSSNPGCKPGCAGPNPCSDTCDI